MKTRDIVKRFKEVKDYGDGHYMARCPMHDDRTPSLSITSKDGVTLIHDFGGCNTKDILYEVGLTLRDLYD